MATDSGVNQGKTVFLEGFLASHRDANLEDVKKAWTAAGNNSTISDSLIGKIRSKLGLTGKRGTKGGATDQNAASAPKGMSSKGTKGASKAEETPSQPNVQKDDKGPSKSAFVGEMLRREPGANLRKVNEAWVSAGFEGQISPSIYYKIKRERGLTGDQTYTSPAKSKPESASRVPASHKRAEAGSEPEGVPAVSQPVVGPRSGDREKVLDRVEDGIDDLIIELKKLGGMEEALEAMRKVRRVVVRSHQG